MPSKSPQKPSAKKAGKSLKEKREAKREKKEKRPPLGYGSISRDAALPAAICADRTARRLPGCRRRQWSRTRPADRRRRDHRGDHRRRTARPRGCRLLDRAEVGVGSRRRCRHALRRRQRCRRRAGHLQGPDADPARSVSHRRRCGDRRARRRRRHGLPGDEAVVCAARSKRCAAPRSSSPHPGLLQELSVNIVEGPDDYLYGEEKALLEVIEGRDPLPRLLPPYELGLFATDSPIGWESGIAARVGTTPSRTRRSSTTSRRWPLPRTSWPTAPSGSDRWAPPSRRAP